MSPQAPGPTSPGEAKWPDDDDWPDDDWPDDDGPGDRGSAGGGRPGVMPPAFPGGGGPGGRRVRPLSVAAVALVALAAGVGVTLALDHGPTRTPAASVSTPSSQPSYLLPTQASGGFSGNSLPGSSSSGGKTLVYTMAGKVLAVSSTSITIGGNGQAVKATVTKSTQFQGKDTSISQVKAGDLVVAQVLEAGGKTTATSIQDPAGMSPGSSLP
jgi:hypothetical protein